MILSKMSSKLSDHVVYSAHWLKDIPTLNDLIGKSISINYTGKLVCQVCEKETKKFFGEGFCFKCFTNAPQASPCILKPELCRAHHGEGRDQDWEERNHNQPHIVYLASTDVVKVGVTRTNQIPTRWIDQGASSAIIFAETPNRYEAGILEVALKSFYSDKTNYRKMLQNEIDLSIDLIEEKWQTVEQLPSDLQLYISENDEITALQYPVEKYPISVKTVNFENTNHFQGILTGIKGQYLIFDNDFALNVRKHTGYDVDIRF